MTDYTEPLHAACRAVSADYDHLPPMARHQLGTTLLPAVAAAVDTALTEAAGRVRALAAAEHAEAARTGQCAPQAMYDGLTRAAYAIGAVS